MRKNKVFLCIFLIVFICNTLFPQFVSANYGDYSEYGYEETKSQFQTIDEDKNTAPYIVDDRFKLTESKLVTTINNYQIKLYDNNGVSGTHSSPNKTVYVSQGDIVFENISQMPIIKDKTIYANFYFYYNNTKYTGLIPIKVESNDNGYEFEIMTQGDVLHVFEKLAGEAVGSPTFANNVLIYPVQQWIIKYSIDSNGKMKYESSKESVQSGVGLTTHSIGGGGLFVKDNNSVYFGSWNGRLYKVNASTFDVKVINLREHPSSNDYDSMNNARIASEPTVVTDTDDASKRRIVFSVGTNEGVKKQAGAICSVNFNLDMSDLRCSVGNKYYGYDGDKITLPNTTGVSAALDSSLAWGQRFGYGFTHDRDGNIYAVDFYGVLKYKNTSLQGSITYGGISLDGNNSFGYIKINSLRNGTNYSTFGSSIYATSSELCSASVPGRLFRIDANSIAWLINQNPNKVTEQSQLYESNLRTSGSLGDASSIIYSSPDWKMDTELTGHPIIIGKSVLASSAGCGTNSMMVMFNAQYDASDNIVKYPTRPNADANQSGRLTFLYDRSGKSYTNTESMARFAGPVGGILFHDDFQESIVVLTGFGLMIVYLQQSDLVINDLSVTSTESDGKFYQTLPNEDLRVYDGHIRVTTPSNGKKFTFNGASVNKEQIVVKVYQTKDGVGSNNSDDKYVCNYYQPVAGDPYQDTSHVNSCEYLNGTTIPSNYNRTSLLNNNGSMEELYSKTINVKDIPGIEKVTSPSGTVTYVLKNNTVVLDDTFNVYKRASSNTSSAQLNQLVAYIDILDNVAESNESNNVGFKNIFYEGTPKPDLDLICNIPPASDGIYKAGQTYYGTMIVRNNSEKVPAKSGFNYQISRNDVLVSSGNFNKSDFPGQVELGVGQSVSKTFAFYIPDNSSYHFQIDINTPKDSGSLPESLYTNNTCDFDIYPDVPTLPDIQAMSVGASNEQYKFKFTGSSVSEGYDISVRGIIKNIGSQRANNDFKNYLRVSYGGTTKMELFTQCKGAFSSNETCEINLTLPKSIIQKGTYYTYLKGDYGYNDYDYGVITESNEVNNVASKSFTISEYPSSPPTDTMTPNGGGITDYGKLLLSTSNLYIDDYSTSYTIGIFNESGTMIKTLAGNSTSFRFPHVGDNPNFVSSQSAYSGSYLNHNSANSSWNALPKSNGYYMWDGRNDSGNIVADGNYKIGITYTYERTNPVYNDWLVPDGCSYQSCGTYTDSDGKTHSYCDTHYYSCWLHAYPYPNDYYSSNSYFTSTNYGNTIALTTRLEITNAEITPTSVKSSQHLYIPDNVTTTLEASEVTVSFPKDLIETEYLKSSKFETIGDKVVIWLEPKWPASPNYDINQTYRCNGDPYCNQWKLKDDDAIVINKFAPDGEYDIVFKAITAWETPNSPAYVTTKIRLEDAIYNHIKSVENF